MRDKCYYVYIMSSKGRVLYVGVTGALFNRVMQHKAGEVEGFTKHYRVHRLAYYEVFQYVNNAILREKQIKGWRREKKVALIEGMNPAWEDLAAEWGKTATMRRVPVAEAARAKSRFLAG
jgi:putative endonuclease